MKLHQVLSIIFLYVFSGVVTASDEVQLEYARHYFSNPSGSCDVCSVFNGVIEVKNIAPEKHVVVHFADAFASQWQTVDAEFVGASRPGYEFWSFSVDVLGDFTEFAIEYQVNGDVYWDNNNHANYQIMDGEPLIIGEQTNIILLHNEEPLISRIENEVRYSGIVHAQSIGFEKEILIRCSTDNWETFQDIPAFFVEMESNGIEQWNFNLQFFLGEPAVEFAIAYEVNGEIYWDNNLGRNYRFEFP